MQDSSTNPFIPQETQDVRRQTETLNSPLKRTVKLLLIITSVLAVLIGAGLIFLIPKTTSDDKKAHVELGNALQPPAQLSKLVPVKSTLGFSVNYDNQMFNSYAETPAPRDANGKEEGSGAYYENDDLRTPRDYSLVRITPTESIDSNRAAIADPPELVINSSITTEDLKANESKPDYKGMSQLALFVELSKEKKVAARTADDGSTVTIDATKPSNRTIGSITYQKIRYTTKNENNRITNVKYDDCYYTIQNSQPYAACITNVRPTSVDAAALDEQLLQSLAFHKTEKASAQLDTETSQPSTGASAADKKTQESANATDEEPEEDTKQLEFITKKPAYNSDSLSLKSIAMNQPSTVRIASLYCADLDLKLESGDTATKLTDACVGNLASGTFVSKDGLLATTGHAIRYEPKAAINGYINFAENQKDLQERLQRILDYLLKARLILQSDADYLKTGAQIGDQEALAKIENIGSVIPDDFVTASNDNYSYAIQPTDAPVVIDTSTASRPSFAYSDSVLSAKFVAADYDASKSAQEVFSSDTPAKDVGLLKAEGSFQNVPVAPGDGSKANDVLNSIGYQAFTDTSLVISKNQNKPVVNNAKVSQTYDKDGRRLIQVGAPVLPGHDGAGTFNQNGDMVGLAVYGLSYCPDQQCFAGGTVRSANELLNLLADKNMNLGTLSNATETWRTAVDDYFKGNYAAAQSGFAKAGSEYQFNRFAEPLAKLAQSKRGSAGDTSLYNQAVGAMVTVLIIMIVLTVLLAIIFVLQKKRLDSLRVGHYGAEPQQSAPVQQQPVMQQPTQQQYYPQPQPLSQPYQNVQQPPVSPPAVNQQPYPYQQPTAVDPQAQQQPIQPQQQPIVQPQQPAQPQPNDTQPPSADDPFYRQQ